MDYQVKANLKAETNFQPQALKCPHYYWREIKSMRRGTAWRGYGRTWKCDACNKNLIKFRIGYFLF